MCVTVNKIYQYQLLIQILLTLRKDAGDNVAQNEISKKRVAVAAAEDSKSLSKVRSVGDVLMTLTHLN